MTFLDFFSGIGTIRLGFEQAGWVCKGHVEWNKYAQQSYTAMHDIKGDEFCGWDISEVRANELPTSDLWAFGAPCQDFSIAGLRRGLDGDRSSLVKEIFRLVRETKEESRPTWLLYENVKGMLSSNGGWDFLGIITEMGELGYDLEWSVLNSKNHGVPQNRERVFLIGHLRGRSTRKVFPFTDCRGSADDLQGHVIGTITTRTGGAGSVGTYIVDGDRIPQKVKILTHRKGYRRNTQVYDPTGITEAIDTMQGGGRQPHVAIAIPIITPDRIEKRQNGRRYKKNGDPMFTLTAQDRHGVIVWDNRPTGGKPTEKPKVFVREATKKGFAVAEVGDSINLDLPNSKTRRGRVGKGVAATLTTNCNQAVVVPMSRTLKTHDAAQAFGYGSQKVRIRKLTPLECWRLQGVPDEYFYRAKNSGVSDSQLYKQAGNACTVNVIYEIARRLHKDDHA